ncbi:MAG: NADH-quinone oxidoreductase subunit NuoK [Thermoguttaceae bacterium]|nr:NADH-quinone oxidoreductase subunit NuoK [Thermoguttaceae bacterium]MDW8079047.1 NADH-quinone oxidoreductase subunit NuoK [Thermoguttaceae bacterium]
MNAVTCFHYYVVACVLFVTGLFCILSKRNIIAVLLGAELVLNGASLNFATLGVWPASMVDAAVDGQLLALFVIVLAAAEAALALGIALSFYHLHRAPDVDEARELHG